MRNKEFYVWAKNREKKFFAKTLSWSHRPVGAFMRAIEKIYLGNTLELLVRAHNDIDEIRHMNSGLREFGEKGDLIIDHAFTSTRSGLTHLESGHILATHLNSHSYLSGKLIDEVRTLIKVKPERLELTNVMVLPKQDYFYHFLIDFLPHMVRLSLLFDSFSLVVNEDENDFVFEYLEFYKIRFFVTSAKTVSARKIILPNFGALSIVESQSILLGTRDKIKENGISPEKIALLRFRGARHDYAFETILKNKLLNENFVVLDPDELTIDDQIRYFNSAKEIVAIHGGALANLIYCSKGTKVVEIFTHPYRTYFFESISKQIGLKYISFESNLVDFQELVNFFRKNS